MTDWMLDPRLQEVVSEAQSRAEALSDERSRWWNWMCSVSEDDLRSPIEGMLFYPLVALLAEDTSDHGFLVLAGRRFGPFVADLTLCVGWGNPFMAIEADGRQWHDRSEDQAHRDRSRDRQMLREFECPVIRFMGSEIYRRPFECAEEALDTFRSVLQMTKLPDRFIDTDPVELVKRGLATTP